MSQHNISQACLVCLFSRSNICEFHTVPQCSNYIIQIYYLYSTKAGKKVFVSSKHSLHAKKGVLVSDSNSIKVKKSKERSKGSGQQTGKWSKKFESKSSGVRWLLFDTGAKTNCAHQNVGKLHSDVQSQDWEHMFCVDYGCNKSSREQK